MRAHRTTLPRGDLAAIVRHQAGVLAETLPDARRGKARAVRRARVASRRLREVLPVVARVAPGARERKLERLVRRITGTLGPLRELDVALAEFDEDTPALRWSGEMVDAVRRHLEAERARHALRARKDWVRIDVKGLRRYLTRLEAACADLPASAWRPVLARRLHARAEAMDCAIRAAGTLYVVDAIHRIRIAAKKLRYTLEFAYALGAAPLSKEIARLKTLQDLLGRLRDLQVLEEHVRIVMVSRATDRQVGAALDQALADLERECRTLHATFIRRASGWRRLAARASGVWPGVIEARPRPARMGTRGYVGRTFQVRRSPKRQAS